MNKIIKKIFGIILILVGLWTLIPTYGLGWYVQFIELMQGMIGIILLIVGALIVAL